MAWSHADSILPPEWKTVWFLFEVGRGIREASTDFPPLLIWQTSDGGIGTVQLFYPMGGLPTAADEVLLELADLVESDIVWFSLILDAYGRTMQPEDSGPTHVDELGDMFRLGDPDIVEQLMALVAYDGEVRVWRQIYRNSDVDGWEWDEPEWMKRSVLSDAPLMGVLELHAMITALHDAH